MLAGCASGEKFSPKPAAKGKGIVHVYWPTAGLGFGETLSIRLDGQPVGSVKVGGFMSFQAKPGQHTVSLRAPVTPSTWIAPPTAKIRVKAGRAHYVKVGAGIDGLAYSPTGPLPVSSYYIRPMPCRSRQGGDCKYEIQLVM